MAGFTGLLLSAGLLAGSSLRGQTMGGDAVFVSPSGTQLRLLIDEKNLGAAEVEVGEITFQPGADSGDHVHGSTEIFYVLSGELEHVVNGKSHLLKPGMIGWVRPPDKVGHKVPGKEPARALVIWAPGGEAARIVANWRKEP
jgi:quercetin dioxygenase-like cupin family protein